MNTGKGKTALLAAALGVSEHEAKAFGDEVNQCITRQGGRSASFAEIAEIMRTLPAANRTPQAVAMCLLHKDTNTGTATRETPSMPSLSKEVISRAPAVQSPEPTSIETATIAYVQSYYLTLLVRGERVNCLRDRWPFAGQQPVEGMSVEIRYRPSSKEVTEILRIVLPNEQEEKGFAADAGKWQRRSADSEGFNQSYFEERQREGHRFEIMDFIGEERQHIEWYRVQPARSARYARPRSRLNSDLMQALRHVGRIEEFYVHQARALDALRAGRHLLLVTQTASGKTWCYNPAIFETLCAPGSNAHALYVFPLNALLMDQKQKIDDLRAYLNARGRTITAEVLQRGIERHARLAIAQQAPDILCVNPELLSVILREAGQYWMSFFGRLRYIVLDEIHSYRGLLGLHMAGIIRRLVLASRRYGSSPQFILSSATVNNPLDLATRLTSLPADEFEMLDETQDGSQQPCKHWIVYSPDAAADDAYDGYLATAADIMVRLLTAKDIHGRPAPLNTILFARSMRDVEKAYGLVCQNLRRRAPHLANRIRKFIGARLEAAEKRDIYEGLRDGRYVGVVSTNALEAGIDIGKLDACIIAGFPFTIMRMRQMAGRVGRQSEGLVVYVPHPVRPVDEYYRHHPDLLLEQKPEAFVIDADNPYIARKHLNAAAEELKGIGLDEAKIFGSRLDEMVTEAIAKGVMKRYDDRLFGTPRPWNHTSDPYAITNIRSSA
ncbi:MAG: DEAD/DEAH box helicase, partial [Anaerolineae bacterium]